jgi:hypothetical protein
MGKTQTVPAPSANLLALLLVQLRHDVQPLGVVMPELLPLDTFCPVRTATLYHDHVAGRGKERVIETKDVIFY